MKILMVCSEFPLLSETFILDQVTGLIDRGHDVRILAKRPRTINVQHTQVDEYGLTERTTYVDAAVGPAKVVKFVKAAFAAFAEGKRRLVLTACAIAFGKIIRLRPRAIDPLELLVHAKALLKMEPPDIAVCHFGPQGDLAVCLREGLGLKFPVVTVFHGHDMSALLYQKGEQVYRHLLASGDLFLPISDRFRDRLVALGAPAERVMVQRMGLNLALFPDGDCEGTGRGREFLFLSIGRLVEKKGHKHTIRAFANCQASNPGLAMRLVIVGDGILLPELRMLAAQLRLGDAAVFAGGLSRQGVREHLLAANAFVLPSVTAPDGDSEGIPVSIMEAMAMGLPVISTVHSGIPEIVQDGITGILVPERDDAALALAMGKLATAPDFSASMGRAGRRYIADRLDLGIWNDLLVERLSDAIDQAKFR